MAGVDQKSNFCYKVGAVTESQIVGESAGLILSDMGLLFGVIHKAVTCSFVLSSV